MLDRRIFRKIAGLPALALAGLALLASATVLAEREDAAQYFNRGANQYIDDQLEEARQTVEQGLQVHPGDQRLEELKKLLEQQEQQDQQKQDQQEQQKQDQQQNEDQKDQDQDKNEQEKQDQQKQDQQEKEQEKNQDQQEQQEQDREEQPSPDQISREEAEMLLDAMKQDEKAQREKMRIMLGRPQDVEKDW